MSVKESEKVRENKYFRVNYMHFAAKEWKKSNMYTIKAQRVTGAIIPALMHRIPSELRSEACLGESSTRMGDLLGSPRVASPILFAMSQFLLWRLLGRRAISGCRIGQKRELVLYFILFTLAWRRR